MTRKGNSFGSDSSSILCRSIVGYYPSIHPHSHSAFNPTRGLMGAMKLAHCSIINLQHLIGAAVWSRQQCASESSLSRRGCDSDSIWSLQYLAIINRDMSLYAPAVPPKTLTAITTTSATRSTASISCLSKPIFVQSCVESRKKPWCKLNPVQIGAAEPSIPAIGPPQGPRSTTDDI